MVALLKLRNSEVVGDQSTVTFFDRSSKIRSLPSKSFLRLPSPCRPLQALKASSSLVKTLQRSFFQLKQALEVSFSSL